VSWLSDGLVLFGSLFVAVVDVLIVSWLCADSILGFSTATSFVYFCCFRFDMMIVCWFLRSFRVLICLKIFGFLFRAVVCWLVLLVCWLRAVVWADRELIVWRFWFCFHADCVLIVCWFVVVSGVLILSCYRVICCYCWCADSELIISWL